MASGQIPRLSSLCLDYLSSIGFMSLVVSTNTDMNYGIIIQPLLAYYVQLFHILQLCLWTDDLFFFVLT